MSFKLICKIGVVGLLVWLVANAWFLYGPGKGRSPKSAVKDLNFSEAIAAVDTLYASDEGPEYRRHPIPKALAAAKPRSMKVRNEGVYLKTYEGQFVETDGIFILRKGSEFDPELPGGISFYKIHDRIYLYHDPG